jgi:AraC family transcriptional regulator
VPDILPAGEHYGSTLHRWSSEGFAVFHAAYTRAHYEIHGNERASLIFVESGHCTKHVGTRHLELAGGTMWYLPPAWLHAVSFPVATTFIAAEVAGDLLERLRAAGSPLTMHAQLAAPAAREMGARLRREIRESDAVSALVFEGILLNALALAARSRTPRRVRRPPWLSRARELLHARALAPLRLRDIAAAVDVHPGHLSREFDRFFGVGPGEYVRQLRVEYAAGQLADTDTPMVEIALAAGFTDQAHFSRAFRRATGRSPREHRQLSRRKR